MHSDLPKSSLLFQRITETPSTTVVSSAACKQAYGNPAAAQVPDHVASYHNHAVGPNQCCSAVTQQIAAPASTVWSVVRRFDNPQAYKHFVKSCHVILENSVAQIPSSPEIQFVVTDLITDILVKYEGSLPDLFREGHSAVVEGFIKPVVEGIRAKEEEILRSSSKLGVSAIDEFLQLDLQKVFRSTIL